MKKFTKKAFTLAEMMISIGIFMLLMVSISIFVTEGVKNITFQKKILDS
jgi:competence protein ComGC